MNALHPWGLSRTPVTPSADREAEVERVAAERNPASSKPLALVGTHEPSLETAVGSDFPKFIASVLYFDRGLTTKRSTT